PEGLRLASPSGVDFRSDFRKTSRCLESLGSQRRQERLRVETAEALLQVPGAFGEIERDGDDRRGHDGALARILSEPFGNDVAPERSAEEEERRLRLAN